MALTEDQRVSIAKVEQHYARFKDEIEKDNYARFDSDIMRRARVIDATSAGTVIIEVDLGKAYSNRFGIMHGGAAALIFDQFTTSAFIPLISNEALHAWVEPPGGMTRSINITYLRPLPLPAVVRVEAQVIQMGKSVGLVRGNITSADGKKIYFTGEQHKVSAPGSSPASGPVEAGTTKL